MRVGREAVVGAAVGIGLGGVLYAMWRKEQQQQQQQQQQDLAKPSASDTPARTEEPTRLGDGTAVVRLAQNMDALRPKLGGFTRIASDGTPSDMAQMGCGDCDLLPNFLDRDTARQMFETLSVSGGEIAYQQWFHMPGRGKKVKKALLPLSRIKVAMTVGPDQHGRRPLYRFPVNNQKAHGETFPMTPTVERVRQMVEEALGGKWSYNHAVVLYYRDLDDCIGFHKDKPLDLTPGAPIVSVSLGCERVYMLRDDIRNPTATQAMVLPHGALFVLGADTNANYYHSIVKEVDEDGRPVASPASAPCPHRHDFDTNARVSITFRSVATFQDASGRISGAGDAYQELNWPVDLNGQHRVEPNPPPTNG